MESLHEKEDTNAYSPCRSSTHSTTHPLFHSLTHTHTQVENLHEKEDIVETIIMCYTKARAFKQLSRFYDTVAEFEMNENRY